jgi:hypothetical protein
MRSMECLEIPTNSHEETNSQLVELAAEAFARILWQQITNRANKVKGKKENRENQKSGARTPGNLSNFQKPRFQKRYIEPIFEGSNKC